ncbi:sulfatase-like hydrolase/transferase [Micromonospora sp. ALFpr18c]|uniref:sulfatase-like hydrolase/transferase n=1 Tax=Micromonospora sp. ALFpr18c TaxID=1458665 RepID=UPI00124BB807|nr:sulfatase-like hydrolase/transferase [Micromonospora sp. ALFpr18c]
MTLPDRLRRLAGRLRPRSAVAGDAPGRTPGVSPARRGRARRALAPVGAVLAVVLVYAVLVGPDRLGELTPGAFLRIPLEGLLVAALLLALPARPRRVVVAVGGPLLGLLAIVKLADLGFRTALDRPFDLVLDWLLLDDAFGFVRDSAGRAGAVGAAVGAVLLIGVLLLTVTVALRRFGALLVGHERVATRVVAALTVAWVVCAVVGVRIVPGVPVADAGVTTLIGAHADQVDARLRDRGRFTAQIAADPFQDVPGDQLLTGLRGKDVVLAFVESYGRDAVQDPELAPQVNAVLDGGTERLRAAGYDSRSGFLTSPTFGGGSWLAHDTLLSGLWTDNEQRHRSLLASDRLTLNGAFRRAGWQTVGVLPAATQPWPERGFFSYDRYYDAEALGYRGPKFSYAPMPDQYTLSFFQRQVRADADRPIMAEIPLISSHSPWTAVPRMIGWDQVGDGSVYHGQATDDGGDADDTGRARAGYRQAIAYSLEALVSYVQTYGDDDLVLVFVGDHQPAPVVTGEGASRDVPITIVARDRAVLDQVAGWGWQPGLRPGPAAPVWPMDTFRDRFLTAFGPSTQPLAAPR